MTDIDQLIEKSLAAARATIQERGECAFLVLIVHPAGVQALIFRAEPSNPKEEEILNDQVNFLMAALHGNMVIFIADKWIAEGTASNFVAFSSNTPFPGRRKALIVEVHGSNRILSRGIQRYWRSANGQVGFEELVWGEPLDESNPNIPADAFKES